MIEANRIVNALTGRAQEMGPRDPITLVAFAANAVLRFILMLPLFLLSLVTTTILGLLVTLSFGLLLYPLSAIWMLFFGLLLGSSWLWIRAWYLRPVLLLPGVLIAAIGFAYVSLVPDMGEKYQKALKLGLCDSWPFSHLTFRLSLQQASQPNF
jgi:hypothetical protein